MLEARNRSLVVFLVYFTFLFSFGTDSNRVFGQYEDRATRLARVEKTFGDPPGMKRLSEKDRVWVDVKKKRIVVDGYIAMRLGQLEMFACPAGTKEHESVVGLFAKAQYVHAGLLAVGAKTGTPVKWEPAFSPPTGSEIQISVLWVDADNKKQVTDARKWVREMGKQKELDVNWVFAGSSFWKDPDTGEERYMAESGDLVCLSNFSTATLDVPIKSSQANAGLLFTAFTDRIPPEGTAVRLVFQVVDDANKGKAPDKDSTQSKPEDAGSPKKPSEASGTKSSSPAPIPPAKPSEIPADLFSPTTSSAPETGTPKQ